MTLCNVINQFNKKKKICTIKRSDLENTQHFTIVSCIFIISLCFAFQQEDFQYYRREEPHGGRQMDFRYFTSTACHKGKYVLYDRLILNKLRLLLFLFYSLEIEEILSLATYSDYSSRKLTSKCGLSDLKKHFESC